MATDLKQDDSPEPARLPTTFTGDPLLEYATSQISVILTLRHVRTRLEQFRIEQACLPRKPSKLLDHMDGHRQCLLTAMDKL